MYQRYMSLRLATFVIAITVAVFIYLGLFITHHHILLLILGKTLLMLGALLGVLVSIFFLYFFFFETLPDAISTIYHYFRD